MRKATLEKMQTDSTLSEIQRMAAGSLLKTRKCNYHRDLPRAAKNLQQIYTDMDWAEALEYVTFTAVEADDREWTG